MVKEVNDAGEFSQEIQGPGLVVVDFFATWCGPCNAIAPFLEQLASKYPNVKFVKVNVDQSSVAKERGIRSMPTFQFFVKGQQVDELKGGNPSALESKVVQHKVDNAFESKGFTLGEDASATATPMSLREMRMKAFQSNAPAPTPAPAAKDEEKMVCDPETGVCSIAPGGGSVEFDDDELAKAIAMSVEEAGSKADGAKAETKVPEESSTKMEEETEAAEVDEDGEEMVPVPVNEELLAQLLEMGCSDVRARKGLTHGGTVEGALNWITENENDPNIDQPYLVKKSDAVPKTPLTAEEKAQKALELKEKIAKRKEEKARIEKEAEIKREKERRERGKTTAEVEEERNRMARKREIEKQKREKMDAQKERERLRAEIARDKEIRRQNKGMLPSKLGTEGYNPAGVQYEVKMDGAAAEGDAPAAGGGAVPPAESAAPPAAAAKPSKPASVNGPSSAAAIENPEQKIDMAISTLSKYRTAMVGGNALKLLHTMLKNIAASPEEVKYRSINTEGNAFKSKLANIVGPAIILQCVGFAKFEEEGKYKLEGDVNLPLLQNTVAKLAQAEETYRKMNP